MSTIEAEAVSVSPLFQRVERERRKPRPKVTPQDRLVDEALAVWKQWVMTYLAPRDSTHRLMFGPGTTFEESADNCFMPRTRKGPGNPTLAAVLDDERSLQAWPKTIHALITDLPRTHRCALLGEAMGYSQANVGAYVGVSQQRIAIVIKLARRTLAIQLAVMTHVRRAESAIVDEESRRHA